MQGFVVLAATLLLAASPAAAHPGPEQDLDKILERADALLEESK